MDKRIHYSRLADIMQRTDDSGNPKPFSFSYVKMDGTLRKYVDAIFSSIHADGTTVNIIPKNERRPKKFHRILIIEINNYKVYL